MIAQRNIASASPASPVPRPAEPVPPAPVTPPEAARTASPRPPDALDGVLSRAVLARVAIKNGAAKFDVNPYEVVDPDNGNDTARKVGLKIKFTYTSAPGLRSDKIGFVQVMKSTKDGKPYLFTNEKNRATTGFLNSSKGWVVDRLKDKISGIYGQNDDGSAGGNTSFGFRVTDTDHFPAWMTDQVGLNRAVGQTVTVDAVTYAFDETNGRYLGGVSWGFATSKGGTTKSKKVKLHEKGNPSGVHKQALKMWNAQADLAVEGDRNAPGQTHLVVP